MKAQVRGLPWAEVAQAVAVVGGYAVLLWLHDATDAPLTPGWFATWAGMLVLTALAWVVVLRFGRRRYRKPATEGAPRGLVVRYVVIAAAATVFLSLVTSRTAFLAPHGSWLLRAMTSGLLLLGWVAAAPWTLLLWRTHHDAPSLDGLVAALQPATWNKGTAAVADPDAVSAVAGQLRSTWQTLESAAVAFGVLLSSAVLDTGMLRLAALSSGDTTAERAPVVLVLLYGAFFALVAALLFGPVAFRWRRQALALVDRVLGDPPTGLPSEEYLATRDRFLTHLGVRTGVMRTPVTALSVLAPLGTALLTSLVPTG